MALTRTSAPESQRRSFGHASEIIAMTDESKPQEARWLIYRLSTAALGPRQHTRKLVEPVFLLSGSTEPVKLAFGEFFLIKPQERNSGIRSGEVSADFLQVPTLLPIVEPDILRDITTGRRTQPLGPHALGHRSYGDRTSGRDPCICPSLGRRSSAPRAQAFMLPVFT